MSAAARKRRRRFRRFTKLRPPDSRSRLRRRRTPCVRAGSMRSQSISEGLTMTYIAGDGQMMAARIAGSVAGVAISLIYMLPHGKREAATRLATGLVAASSSAQPRASSAQKSSAWQPRSPPPKPSSPAPPPSASPPGGRWGAEEGGGEVGAVRGGRAAYFSAVIPALSRDPAARCRSAKRLKSEESSQPADAGWLDAGSGPA